MIEIPSLDVFKRSLETIINKNSMVILDTNIILPDVYFSLVDKDKKISDRKNKNISLGETLNIYSYNKSKFLEIMNYKKDYIKCLGDYSRHLNIIPEVKEEILKKVNDFIYIQNDFNGREGTSYYREHKKVFYELNFFYKDLGKLVCDLKDNGRILNREDFDNTVYDIILEKCKLIKMNFDMIKNGHYNFDGLHTDENLVATSIYTHDFRNIPVNLISSDRIVKELIKNISNGNGNHKSINVYRRNRFNYLVNALNSLNYN